MSACQLWDRGLNLSGYERWFLFRPSWARHCYDFEATSNYRDVHKIRPAADGAIKDYRSTRGISRSLDYHSLDFAPRDPAVPVIGANIDSCLAEDPDSGLKFYLS